MKNQHETIDQDQAAHKVIETLRVAQAALQAYDQARGAKSDLFGAKIRVGLADVFDHRAYVAENRALFGIPARPDKQTQLIQSCESNLESARQLLASLESKKGRWYKLGEKIAGPNALDIDAARERVEIAELNLARAKGQAGDLEAQKKAERMEKARAERIAFSEGVAANQERVKMRHNVANN